MEKNEFELAINNFINSDTVDYAFLINGQWGSGKTHFINNFISQHHLNDRIYIKISLFGIKDTSELTLNIISAAASFKDKPKDFIILLKEIISKIPGIKEIASFKSLSPDIILKYFFSTLMKDKKIILVFDDFERTSIDLKIVLGYISNIIGMENFRCIIIANENEIINIDKEKIYDIYREKIIWKSIDISTLEIHNHLNVNLPFGILKYDQSLKQGFFDSGIRNIRLFIRGATDFDVFLKNDKLSLINKLNEDTLQDLAYAYMLFHMILKSKSLKKDEFLKKINELYSRDKNGIASYPDDWFDYFEKTNNENLYKSVIKKEIERKDTLDKLKTDEKKHKEKYFWVTLFDITRYESDNDIAKDIKKTINYIEKLEVNNIHNITDLYDLVNIIQLLYFYNYNNLTYVKEKWDVIRKRIMALITDIENDAKIKKIKRDELAKSNQITANNHGLYYDTINIHEYFEVKDKILSTSGIAVDHKESGLYFDILKAIEDTNIKEGMILLQSNETPHIFKERDPNDLLLLLYKSNPKEIIQFINYFAKRYSSHDSLNSKPLYLYHIEELSYLEELFTLLMNSVYSDESPCLSSYLKKEIKTILEPIIRIMKDAKLENDN